MKIAILDETPEITRYIADNLEKFRTGWEINTYTTPFALVTGIYDEHKGDMDLVMVRIGVGCEERIEMMRDIQDYFPHIRAIFYSDMTDYAEEIFRAIPTYFLKLPLDEERLMRALERAEKLFREDVNQSVAIHTGGKLLKLRFTMLRYIESIGRKLIFYTDNGAYEANMNMESIIEQLPETFLRCHRSYIVNLNCVAGFETGTVSLYSGEIIPVSRSNHQTMKEKLCRLL